METETKAIKALLLQKLSNPPDDSSGTSDHWEVDRLIPINKVCKYSHHCYTVNK